MKKIRIFDGFDCLLAFILMFVIIMSIQVMSVQIRSDKVVFMYYVYSIYYIEHWTPWTILYKRLEQLTQIIRKVLLGSFAKELDIYHSLTNYLK